MVLQMVEDVDLRVDTAGPEDLATMIQSSGMVYTMVLQLRWGVVGVRCARMAGHENVLVELYISREDGNRKWDSHVAIGL